MSDTIIHQPEKQEDADYLKREQQNLFRQVPPESREDVVEKKAALPGAKDEHFHGKLIVAVHGMGDQVRNDFVQTIARLFARYYSLPRDGSVQARLLPLGAWDGGRETCVDDPAVRFIPAPGSEELEDYAFAEMYWADIPRTMEEEGYRLEEMTHWARTVVERLAQRHGPATDFGPKQFHLAGFVLEEIAETVRLLENIAAAGKLLGISKQVVSKALTQYMGDVQQVGDFQRQREKIRERFLNRLELLHQFYPNAEIHIIAHSEGTVTTLFTLLSAMCWKGRDEVQERRVDAARQKAKEQGKAFDPTKVDPHSYAWLERLRSFTTMGSPIDKHIHLWPEMWQMFEGGVTWIRPPQVVRWRNYYDFADPVGYELDSARMKLEVWKCPWFEFKAKIHDHGYRRYPLPGQAHLDYFTDDGLFAHVIENAVLADKVPKAKPPANSWRGILSPVVPFALVAGLLFAAVFALHRGLLPKDGSNELQKCLEKLCCSAGKDQADAPWLTMPSANSYGLLGCWAMLIGSTMLARILRLTRDSSMVALAVGAFIVGAVVLWFSPGPFVLEAGYHAGGIILKFTHDLQVMECASKIAFIAWSLVGVGLAWVADYYACSQRWRAIWALRLFILTGTVMLGAMLVLPRLKQASGDSAVTLLGGLAGFAALWWLATLLFDLSFCWQRYINTGRSWIDRLWPERKKAA